MVALMDSNPFHRSEFEHAPVLERKFYQRRSVEVARDLLGKLLLRRTVDGLVAVRVTEVEAYLGPEDPACHTYGGRRTARVRTMWGEAGRAYVYLIYGIHHCLNLVTVGAGAGEAVLVRGGLIVHGEALARRRRGSSVPLRSLTDGPGKLCQALDVDRCDDGVDACDPAGGLWLGDDGVRVGDEGCRRDARVGVGYAGEAAAWPLRFRALDG
jgi:DNA-3-methyladenine glycosylase